MKPGGAWQTKLLCAAVVALYLAASCHAAPALGTSRPETGQGAAPGQSGAGPVSTFPINETLAYPLGVTTDHSGDVWYAEDNLDALVELIPSNSTTRTFAIPTPHHLAWIWFMVFDQGGVLWFSDESQQLIWSFNPATETFANYTAGGAYPFALQYDQQRSRIWFTSLRTDQVGYFAIEGGTAILEKTANFSAPQPGSGVSGIAVDSAGNLYVAESFQAKIVELDGTTLSIVRTWSLPVGSQPVGLALDQPRGRLWFTDHASSFFGYVDLNSTGQTLFSTSLFFAGGANAVTLPYWISLSASGDVWFNEHSANRIARFDPSTLQLTEFVI
ncbi:MAG TPA: hypothetical protein VJR06_00270, partial [Nitrososphaerales archaeon]|nr:hypothetical protein [Nitrososphaerales archaeon]